MAIYNMGFHDAKLAWGNWDYVDLSHFSNIPPGGVRTSAVTFVKECREKAPPPGILASVASFTAGIALHRMYHHQKRSDRMPIPTIIELPTQKACGEVQAPSHAVWPILLKCSGAAVLVMAASRRVRKRIWRGARLPGLKESRMPAVSSTPSEQSPQVVAIADGSLWTGAVGGVSEAAERIAATPPRPQGPMTCVPWTSPNVCGGDRVTPEPPEKPAEAPQAQEAKEPQEAKEEKPLPPPSHELPRLNSPKGSKGPQLKGKGKGKQPPPPKGKGTKGAAGSSRADSPCRSDGSQSEAEPPKPNAMVSKEATDAPQNRKPWSAPKTCGASLLDTARATNLAIMLKKLPVCPVDFCQCVKKLDSSHPSIRLQHIELVLSNMLTQSEINKLLSYDESEGPLRDVECEVLPLCSVSSLALKVLKVAMAHEEVYARHMGRCRTIANAAQEVCGSRQLRDILCLILRAGNYITSGEPAKIKAFNVDSLQSLSTSKIGAISVIHFLCISFRGSNREFLDHLKSGLPHVHAAAKENFGQLDLDIHGSFKDDVRIVEQRLAQVKQEVDSGQLHELGQHERLGMLSTSLTSELETLKTSFASARQLSADVQEYFTAAGIHAAVKGAGKGAPAPPAEGQRKNPLPAEAFFGQVCSFLGTFQAAWEEIEAQPAKWQEYLSKAKEASTSPAKEGSDLAQQLCRQSCGKQDMRAKSQEIRRQTSSSSEGHAFSDVSSVSTGSQKRLKLPIMHFVSIRYQPEHSPGSSRSASPTERTTGADAALPSRRPKSRSPPPNSRKVLQPARGKSFPMAQCGAPKTSSQLSQSTAPGRSKSPESRSPPPLRSHTPTWGRGVSGGSAESVLSNLSLSYSGQSAATSRSVSPAPRNRSRSTSPAPQRSRSTSPAPHRSRSTSPAPKNLMSPLLDDGDKSYSESSASSAAATPRRPPASSREPSAGSHGGHVGAEFLPDISRNVHAPGSEEASRTPRARAEKPRTDDLCEFHVLHDEAGQESRLSGFEQVLRRLGVRRAPEEHLERQV